MSRLSSEVGSIPIAVNRECKQVLSHKGKFVAIYLRTVIKEIYSNLCQVRALRAISLCSLYTELVELSRSASLLHRLEITAAKGVSSALAQWVCDLN